MITKGRVNKAFITLLYSLKLVSCHKELFPKATQAFWFKTKNLQNSLYTDLLYTKQNRSTEGCSKLKRSVDMTRTEGCSKLKRSVDMTSSGKNGLNSRTNASPIWDRTCVRRSKRPLLASCIRCKCPVETSWNKVITSKTVIRSSLVTRSRFSEMSDQLRVSLSCNI